MLSIKPRPSHGFRSIQAMPEAQQIAVQRGLYDAGASLVKELREQTKEQKTGRHYGRNPYQSAAPGETPAFQHGGYYRSVGYRVSGGHLTFGIGVEYAKRLEEGGFPGLENALNSARRDVERAVLFAIAESFQP